MENKLLYAGFPFKLEQLEDVTLRRVRCSCAFELAGQMDVLDGWIDGLNDDLIEKFWITSVMCLRCLRLNFSCFCLLIL